jgi:hypothetical protein
MSQKTTASKTYFFGFSLVCLLLYKSIPLHQRPSQNNLVGLKNVVLYPTGLIDRAKLLEGVINY